MNNAFSACLKRLRNIRSSLYVKISCITIGSLCVLSGAMVLLMQNTMKEMLSYQIEQRGYETAQLIATLNANDILLSDYYNILVQIKKIKENNENIRYILVCNYKGEIIAHTFMDGIPEGLPISMGKDIQPPYVLTKFDSDEGMIYEINAPIENGNVGFIRIGICTDMIQLLLQKELRNFFCIIFVIFIVTVFLSILLASIIVKPLHQLTAAVNNLKDYNYAAQMEYRIDDEIGTLARAFNAMARSLAYTQRENNEYIVALTKREEDYRNLIHKLFTVQEDERRRLSRELHDGAGQSITSILAYLRVVLLKTKESEQREILQQAREVVVDVQNELRQMAINLRPPILDKFGVTAAIEKHLAQIKEHHSLEVKLMAPETLQLPDTHALALYRCAQESLTNILRHADATAVVVSIERDETFIYMEVSDNGHGFPTSQLEEFRHKNHLGIYGMKERVELLGGTFFIDSSQRGTSIKINIPLAKEDVRDEKIACNSR